MSSGVEFDFLVFIVVLSFQMAIIFNEAGLGDIEPPCVVQSFVNHNARLFKIFVVGQRHFVVQRPSIRNCYAGGFAFTHLLLVLNYHN